MFFVILNAALLVPDTATIIETNKTLELNLHVIEAFENGPVVFDVSVTNRGMKPMWVAGHFFRGSSVTLPEAWKRTRRNHIPGCAGLSSLEILATLQPGETFTEHHSLHDGIRGQFPPGTHDVQVEWALWTAAKDRNGFLHPWKQLAAPRRTFPITISPATAVNRLALAARLEAEFAALPPTVPKDAEGGGPFGSLSIRAIHSPHKELNPLRLKLLDRVLFNPESPRDSWPMRMSLVESIVEADPANAHRLFVDRLLVSPPQTPTDVVFRIWEEPIWSRRRIMARFGIILHPECYFDRRYWPWAPFEEFQELAKWNQEMAPRVLPDAELKRLAEAKDPRVRELVRKTFDDRLPK